MKSTTRQHEHQGETKRFATFFIDNTLLGVDISLVQEINEDPVITKVPLAGEYVQGIMNLRGHIITIIDLRRKIGFARFDNPEACCGVIIVNWYDEKIGLTFEKIGEVIEAPEAKLEQPPSNIGGAKGQYFQGVIHTGKNQIVALLDIDSVLTGESSFCLLP